MAVWILAGGVALASLASSFVADSHAAQDAAMSATPAAEESVPQGSVPQGEDPPGDDEGTVPNPGAQPGETLSDQLDRQHGVIEPPPAAGDPDIYVEPPNPDPGTTPVIPPPGTPGGDQSIQPK